MALTEQLKRLTIEHALKYSFNLPSKLPVPTSMLRHGMLMSSRLLKVRQDTLVEKVTLAGHPAEKISPKGQPTTRVILHIHGGVFFLGGLRTHRAFASELAAHNQATVYTLDYPLSPEHLYPHAMLAVKDAFLALVQQGHQAKDIVLSGDSCGSNLALAAVLALRDAKQPLPAALLLQSPFLDSSLSGESMTKNASIDPMLNATLLKRGVDYYIGNYAANHPQVSPLFADLHGLPPTLVQVGGKEVLLDDATRFKALAEQAGNQVTLTVYPDMWHIFPMFSQWLADARTAMDEITQFLKVV